MTTGIIIVAAGRGTRAGGETPKQWQGLRGRRVLDWTLEAMTTALPDAPLVVVLHPDDMGLLDGHDTVAGGGTRAQSVRNGLEHLAQYHPSQVLIHDAARPCVSPTVIQNVLRALQTANAAAPALAVSDALWTGTEGRVTGTQDRAGLFRAQTPQGFRFDAILAAHRGMSKDAPDDVADDVAVARMAGLDVTIVPGDEDNLKITYPGDFARAERILGMQMDIRTGNGFDVHRFGDGDHVVLCGVKVPHDAGLIGHSDADVGMHALTDAIYGALAEGDIGQHFPPSDPQWKGAASEIFLKHAAELARTRGFALTHADVTLICERPKIGPLAQQMRTALAEIMKIDIARVSVKATTSERLGFTGREEGIAAMATVTLVQS